MQLDDGPEPWPEVIVKRKEGECRLGKDMVRPRCPAAPPIIKRNDVIWSLLAVAAAVAAAVEYCDNDQTT